MRHIANTKTETQDDNTRSRILLLQSVLSGVVSGTTAYGMAIIMGRSLWVGLLYHSAFGMLGMMLLLCLGLSASAAPAHRRA